MTKSNRSDTIRNRNDYHIEMKLILKKYIIIDKLSCISNRIKKFVSSGLMVHWRSKFWPPDDACSLKTDGDITVKPVNVMDMTGIFFILGCGKFMT